MNKTLKDKIKEALADNPSEELQAKLNGGYPISKESKLLSLFEEMGNEVIGEDEDVEAEKAKGIPYAQALIYRNEVRFFQRKKLKEMVGK